MISYKALVRISPHSQLRCSWGQRRTDYNLRSKGQHFVAKEHFFGGDRLFFTRILLPAYSLKHFKDLYQILSIHIILLLLLLSE